MEPDSPFERASVLRSLRETRPVPYWLDTPAAAGRATGAHRRRRAATSPSSAPASPASGRRCSPRSRTPARRRRARGRPVGGQASGRNGGICMASLTHGFSRGKELFPGENARLDRARQREPRGDRARREASCPSTAAGSAPARWRSPRRHGRSTAAQAARPVGARRAPRHVARRRSCAPRSTRPRTRPASGTTTRPSSTRRASLGAGARLRGAGRAHLRGHAGHRADARRRRRGAAPPWGEVRAQRAVLATNAFRAAAAPSAPHVVPVYDYALMTEPLSAEQLAAIGWSRRRRWRTPATCSTTTGSPRTSASSGAAGTRCTTAAAASAGVRGPARPVRQAGRSLLPDVPSARGPALHASLGWRDRHLLALLPVLGHRAGRPRLVRARLHGLGVAASRFGARVALDLVHGRRTELTRAGLRAQQAAAVPAGAAAVPADRGHTAFDGARGAPRRAPQRLAAALDRFGLGFDS